MDRVLGFVPCLGLSRAAITGTTTALGADRGKTFDATSGTFSLNLTAAATLGSGWHVIVYNSGSGVVTIDPNASETIRTTAGTVTTLALTQGQGVVLMCDGTGFDVISSTGSAGFDYGLASVASSPLYFI